MLLCVAMLSLWYKCVARCLLLRLLFLPKFDVQSGRNSTGEMALANNAGGDSCGAHTNPSLRYFALHDNITLRTLARW
jgi:hypothetical protein